MNFSFDLSGKNVFVFGGTSGINLGIAEAFVAAGARIGVASRNQDKVDAAVERLSRRDAPAHGFSLDVREPQAVADALASFVERQGRIDVLVSGAAGNSVALKKRSFFTLKRCQAAAFGEPRPSAAERHVMAFLLDGLRRRAGNRAELQEMLQEIRRLKSTRLPSHGFRDPALPARRTPAN